MSDDKKIIFSMSGVSKIYPDQQKEVIKNIHLSFFYGAKIGVLGLNGSGKSSLLKIIAGVDKNYRGEVNFNNEYSIGYLEQEPKVDLDKNVIDIVKEGVSETVKILDEFNFINDQFTLPEVYENVEKMEKLMARQSVIQDEIDSRNAWELDLSLIHISEPTRPN